MSSNILLNNGSIESDPAYGSVADQQQRIRDAVTRASREGKPLVLHLHGGLVKREAGELIAGKLIEPYTNAGGVPLFFVWQTGFLETIQNNYRELLQQALVRWAVKRITRKLQDKLNIPAGLKSMGPWEPDEASMAALVFTDAERDEEETAELQDDELDKITDAILYQASTLKSSETAMKRLVPGEALSAPAVIDSTTPVLLTMNPALLPTDDGGQKALTFGVFKNNVVSAIVATIAAVITRYKNRTHHGFHATLMEELSRRIHGDKFGALIWGAMKQDAADAFKDGDQYAGHWLLKCLDQANPRPRVLLVGHSAGSVFACQLLQHSKAEGKFDVAFLAPAVTYSLFADTLADAENKIANFRMFTMYDHNERKDALIDQASLAYPSSLLYLISGILENEADTPILGMERFYSPDYAASNRDEPLLNRIRHFLNQDPDRIVWSQSDRGPGLTSRALDHSDFDELDHRDGQTVASLAHIIRHGFA